MAAEPSSTGPAAGGTEPATTEPATTGSTTASTTGATQPPTGPPISGVVVRVSDVATIPDRPVTAGAVVIVPEAAVAAFWSAVGLPPGGPPVPGKAEFSVEPAHLGAGGEVATIAEGRFSGTTDVGTAVLLCLADDLQGATQGPPYRVSGCARSDGARVVRVTSGIEGIRAGPA